MESLCLLSKRRGKYRIYSYFIGITYSAWKRRQREIKVILQNTRRRASTTSEGVFLLEAEYTIQITDKRELKDELS